MAPQLRIPGRALLREVLDAYQPYRPAIAARDTHVRILRFTPGPGADPGWAARMHASAVSAAQKIRTFTTLGAHADAVVLPDTVSLGAFAEHIDAANTDPTVAALIVQTPPPARLLGALDRIDPAKDIDALGVESPHPACATADGITRIARPFLDPDTRVAVVGGRGFVGSGVVRLLRAHGHDPQVLELGDDLRILREIDVVISTTGRAGLLTPEHLRPGQRLVIDSGFVPQPGGPRGDVHPDAQHLPAAITPVPGGIGPVEMAVLAERLTVQQAAPDLTSWHYLSPAATPAASPAVLTTVAATVARDLDRDPGRRPAPAISPHDPVVGRPELASPDLQVDRGQRRLDQLGHDRRAAEERAEQLRADVAADHGPHLRRVDEHLARTQALATAAREADEVEAQWRAATEQAAQAAQQRALLEHERAEPGRPLDNRRHVELTRDLAELRRREDSAHREAGELARRAAELQQQVGPPQRRHRLYTEAAQAEATYPPAREAARRRDRDDVEAAQRRAARLVEQENAQVELLARLNAELPEPIAGEGSSTTTPPTPNPRTPAPGPVPAAPELAIEPMDAPPPALPPPPEPGGEL